MFTWHLLGVIIANQSEEKNGKFAEGLERDNGEVEILPAEFWNGVVNTYNNE